MATWKAPPSIMQYMVVLFGADFKRNELMRWCAWRRLASRDEIGSWSPDSVLDDVGNEQRKDHAYEPAQNCDVCFVCARTEDESPKDQGAEGHCAGIDEEPYCTTRLARSSSRESWMVVGIYIHTETRSISAWGYPMARLSRKNMR
jgi:hypothetical protein